MALYRVEIWGYMGDFAILNRVFRPFFPRLRGVRAGEKEGWKLCKEKNIMEALPWREKLDGFDWLYCAKYDGSGGVKSVWKAILSDVQKVGFWEITMAWESLAKINDIAINITWRILSRVNNRKVVFFASWARAEGLRARFFGQYINALKFISAKIFVARRFVGRGARDARAILCGEMGFFGVFWAFFPGYADFWGWKKG